MLLTNGGYSKAAVRMRRLVTFMIPLTALFLGGLALAETGGATSDSCWIDLDRDGSKDIAIFVPEDGGGKLIALLARGARYEGMLLMTGAPGMVLACKLGEQVTETTAIRLEGKRYETGGTYVSFSQPEGAAYAFFWSGSGFQEVLLAD